MKIADVVGLGAAVTVGAYGGYQYSQNGTFSGTDWAVMIVLLGIAFYFAVVLS